MLDLAVVSLFSLLFCSALCFIIGATFNLGIQSWKLAAGIAAVIVGPSIVFYFVERTIFKKHQIVPDQYWP